MIIELGNVSFNTNPVTHDRSAFILSEQKSEYCGWEYLYADDLTDGADVYRGWSKGMTGVPGFYKTGTLSVTGSVDFGSDHIGISRIEYSNGEYILHGDAQRSFVSSGISRGTDAYKIKADGSRCIAGTLSLRMYINAKSEENLIHNESLLDSVESETLAELFCRKADGEYRSYMNSVLSLPIQEVISLSPVITRLGAALSWAKTGRIKNSTAKMLIGMDNALFEIAAKIGEMDDGGIRLAQSAVAAMCAESASNVSAPSDQSPDPAFVQPEFAEPFNSSSSDSCDIADDETGDEEDGEGDDPGTSDPGTSYGDTASAEEIGTYAWVENDPYDYDR